MEISQLLSVFRSMNHLIELDEENLPEMADTIWSSGWVRFHDTLNNSILCINENDPANEEEDRQVGEICVVSGSDYSNSVDIPESQIYKLIKAETMKSNMLENAATNKKHYL